MPACTHRSRLCLGTLLAMALALASPTLSATTWTVDSTSASAALNACSAAPDDCSFPGAVSRLASAGDTIVFAVASSSASEVQIEKSVTIEANGARLPRVAISTSNPVIINATIRDARWEDLSGILGSALYVQPQHSVTLEDVQFRRNTASAATGGGGAIYNAGHLTIRRGVFEANRALQTAGGAILNVGGTPAVGTGSLTVLDSRFEANYAQNGAAAIHNFPYSSNAPLPLTVRNCVFIGNGLADPANPATSARGFFGAIKTDGSTVIESSYFADNDSRYGAAVQSGAALKVVNSTFWRNHTRDLVGEGGALLLAGPTRLVNLTVVGNSGTPTGGLYVYPGADVHLVNSLLADNLGSSPEIHGRVYSIGNNLIRDPTGATIDGNVGANLYQVDARWQAPADNGGTSWTAALASDSPAIDAGSDCVLVAAGCGDTPAAGLDVDQRGSGYPRKVGASTDIGAFEAAFLQVENAQDSGPGSLRQAIANAGNGAVIEFARPFFDQPRTIALASTLVVNKRLTILGPGLDLLTLDANLGRRHLNVDAGAVLNLSGLRLTRGDPGGNTSGGAILINGGSLTASDIRVDDSRAYAGGCIYNVGTLVLYRSLLSACQARASVGALFNESGHSATIADTRIEDSIAVDGAGGVGNAGTLLMFRTSLSSNSARFGGGFSNYGTATLRNVTISGNTATQQRGGGIHVASGASLTLVHATITDNSASLQPAGGLWNDGGTVDLLNSLIADNHGVGIGADVAGVLRSAGHNLIGDSNGNSFAADSSSLVGNLLDAAPRLSALADNGGVSRTHAPLHDSPVFDAAAAALGLDGRNQPRPRDFVHIANASAGNGSDIGAYELQIATPNNLVATAGDSSVSLQFDGDSRGGLAITGYRAQCGTQEAFAAASPIEVGGLAIGVPVSCTVTALSNTQSGIASAPSNSVVPKSATLTAIAGVAPSPSLVGQDVQVEVIVTGISAQPSDGSATVSASSGESCVDATPTPGAGNIATFACTLNFDNAGDITLTAAYSGSNAHTGSTSVAAPHLVASTPTLSIDDVDLDEGDSGNTVFQFLVHRSHALSEIRVDLATVDLGAVAGDDYTELPAQTLLLAPGGPTTFYVQVEVHGDTTWEGDEDFRVQLSNAIGATIVDDQARGMIRNDDRAPLVLAGTAGPNLGGLSQPLTVTATISLPVGAPQPTGVISVSGPLGSGCTISLPALECSFLPAIPGPQTLNLDYPGDANVLPAAAAVTHTVYRRADVSISKDDGRMTVRGGDVLTYSIVVRNDGPDAATYVRVEDPIPASLVAASWTCAGSGCAAASGTGSILQVLNLPSQAQVTYTLTATVASPAPEYVANTAQAWMNMSAPDYGLDIDVDDQIAIDVDYNEVIFSAGFETP